MASHLSGTLAEPVVRYCQISALWIRASLAYPASFWMLTIGGFVIGGLDFVTIWIMFATIDSLGGFGLAEIGFLYGATGFGLALADMVVGRVERLGELVRLGKLDTMMVRPVPLLVQVCADEFALRRLSRIVQAVAVLSWACAYVDWTPARALVTVSMLVSGSVIFFCLFVSLACIQFWTADSSEAANAFTYGGNTITQYPLSVFPRELVRGLTLLVPIAFVSWYPALYVLGHPDPFGYPAWLQFASPLVAILFVAVTALAWRTGVRHYRSTGS